MSQPRRTRIFTATLISIIVTGVILEHLHSKPIQAGAFSLSQFHQLTPIEEIISTEQLSSLGCWNRIEVRFADKQDIAGERSSFHFIVYNDLIGGNGQIGKTSNWKNQVPAGRHKRTIQIGILVTSQNAIPSVFQIKRTEALVKVLTGKFDISTKSVLYKDYWF